MSENKVIVNQVDNKVIVSSPGPQGVAGKTILNGTSAPANNLGVAGDYYYNTSTKQFYGPKLEDLSWDGVLIVNLDITSSSRVTITQVDSNGNPVETYENISTIAFDEDSGFDVTSPSTGTAKIAMNSTFKYWEVDGVQKLTAVGLDTVNFKSGENVLITADGSSDPQSMTISLGPNVVTTTSLGNTLGDYVMAGDVGNPDGVAPLDSNSLIPSVYLPKAASQIRGTVYGRTTSYNDPNGYNSGVAALGFMALNSLNYSYYGNNTAIGSYSMSSGISIGQNTGVGANSLTNIINGSDNTAVGLMSLSNITDANSNTSIGSFSGSSITTGEKNVIMGYGASSSYHGTGITTGINNIILGYQAFPSSQSVSNEITFGDSNINRFRIPGLGIDWTSSSNVNTQLASKMPLSGGTFTGNVYGTNLELSGDLTVHGTYSTVPTQTLTVENPIIYLGEANPADINDLGFVGSHTISGAYSHTGLVRDASDNKWKLFNEITDEPTNTVNFDQGTLDTLAVGALETSSLTVGSVSNTEIGYLDGVTSAIQTQLNAKASINNPTFTGTVILPYNTTINNVSADEIEYLDGVTSSIQTQLNDKISASSTDTLWNKTIMLNANTLTGTLADFNTALSNADFATLAGTETLTNKTISGASNIITNILNSSLQYSSITINGTSVALGQSINTFPSQTGNSGKFLTTNGTTTSWATVNTLPTQSGNSGKYLTTNGSTASWVTISTVLDATPNAAGKVYAKTDTGQYSDLFIGYNAGGSTTVGQNLVVSPSGNLYNTTGNNNIAIGINALQENTSGFDNVALGVSALASNNTGYRNVAIGGAALAYSQPGDSNTAIGFASNAFASGSRRNTSVGTSALYSATTGNENTAIGLSALQNNTTGSNNVAIGSLAGFSMTTGSNNIIIGQFSDSSSATVDNEITLGNNSNNRFRIPGLGIDWTSSTIPGAAATPTTLGTVYGSTDDGSDYNVSLGKFALVSLTTGAQNVAISGAGSLTTGQANVAIGVNSLSVLTTGHSNTSVGHTSGGHILGINNTTLGKNAGNLIYDGNNNTIIGGNAGSYHGGYWNTLVGAYSGNANSFKSSNYATGIGAGALSESTGENNTAVGHNAGQNISGSNNLTLGYDAQASSSTVYDEVTIGNNSINRFRVPGLGIDWNINTVPGKQLSGIANSGNNTIMDQIELSSFTTAKYLISIKMGNMIRSSEIIVQTDGSTVDWTEFGVLETNNPSININVYIESDGQFMRLITNIMGQTANYKIQKTIL